MKNIFSKRINTIAEPTDHYAEMKASISAAIDRALANHVSPASVIDCLESHLPSNGCHSRLSMMALAQKDERNRALPADLAAQLQNAEAIRERRRLQAEEQERRVCREDVERRARNEEWTR
jgi:hypothetical protein